MIRPEGFHEGLFGHTLSGGMFLFIETVMLIILELSPESILSHFAARKICHAGTGLLLLGLDARVSFSRIAWWMVSTSSILMTWNITERIGLKPFRFGASKDVGITIYLILVSLWFYAELPPAALSPMFFADPMGAVVGKALSRHFPKQNVQWYEKKTVGGSMTVFLATCLTLYAYYPPMPLSSLLVLAVAGVFAEAIGGKYDNLCLAAVVIGGYFMLAGPSSL